MRSSAAHPRRSRALLLLLAAGALGPLASRAAGQDGAGPPVRYDDDLLPPEFHASRRGAVVEALPPGAVAIFFGAPERNRQNDVDFEYRQDSDLLYLTGTTEPGTALLLAPAGVEVDGERVGEILFVPERNPSAEVWSGRRMGPERAAERLGVEKAVAAGRFGEIVRPLVEAGSPIVHEDLPEGVREGSALGRQLAALDGAVVSPEDVRALRLTLDRLRMVKTDAELVLLQRAIDITASAHREAMRSIEPGMHEYEVEALVEYVFRREGAEYAGFPSIVGSGENSVILHYETNRRRMDGGDVVVIDIGAEYHGYSADITRTLPVDGDFSTEERAIYELVLRAQRAGIEATRAGASFGAPGQAAAVVLAEGLAGLGLIDSPADWAGLRRFFMHGTSHYLGLDVHDVGTGGPLAPGTVITVEPGIYVAPAPDVDPKWWNIGVRIEDDVLVTAEGPVVLSEGTPWTVEEIEALMAEEGLGNRPIH
ncbi:MAG: aminopeptidase P N-terminal domain-containing protein [Gemmatimonadota bacterium]|jgi:Xaa-Pro aminopeptidase